MCGVVILPLGGSGGMLPQDILKFRSSEVVSGAPGSRLIAEHHSSAGLSAVGQLSNYYAVRLN